MLVDAKKLAEQCRAESEAALEKSELLIAGARALTGIDAKVVHQKMDDALFARGYASACITIADALERLEAREEEEAVTT
jgi:hypothetical protein